MDWNTCRKSLNLWWSWSGSNRRPPRCERGALPAELQPHEYIYLSSRKQFQKAGLTAFGVESLWDKLRSRHRLPVPKPGGNSMAAKGLPVLAGCLLIVGAAALRAQTAGQPLAADQPIIELQNEARVCEHRLGPTSAVHVDAAEARTLGFETYLTFEIVVSAEGRVESATPVGEEKRHLDEARAIEMARTFRPWTRDGKNIRVRVTDYVFLLPPERWALVPQSFPEPWELKGVKIELSRGACFGSCPIYTVRIRGDGSVHFSGQRNVLVPGEHDAHIAPAAVMELVRQFENARFFAAGDKYIARVTDNPTYTLTLTVGGKTKTVTDYVGEQVGMPLAITDLENAVDHAAGTERWIKGIEADADHSGEAGSHATR